MSWELGGSAPVFLQIAEHIRADIVSGRYGPGEQIPPVRQLATEASVNPNTMQRALGILESEGLLISEGTVGRFVCSNRAVIDGAAEKQKRRIIDTLICEAGRLGISEREMVEHLERRIRERGENGGE